MAATTTGYRRRSTPVFCSAVAAAVFACLPIAKAFSETPSAPVPATTQVPAANATASSPVAKPDAPTADAPKAGSRPVDPDFRTLGVRQAAAQMTTDGYDGFYCGSNGGAPLKAIRGWTDYMQCDPDGNGLREVDVTFGTKLERMAQMFSEQYGQQLWMQKYGGTRVANFPVIMSVLFDAGGMSRGFRVVTNPNAARLDRANSYLLRFRIYVLYGDSGWRCDRRGPTGGRTPIGTMYIDETCAKAVPGKRIRVETHLFRRPGETGVSEAGSFMPGEFESNTKWEVFDDTLPPTKEEQGDKGLH